MQKVWIKRLRKRVLLVAALFILLLWIGVPLQWIVSTSFMGRYEIFSGAIIPSHPTIEHYTNLFLGEKATDPGLFLVKNFSIPIRNSLLVALTVMVLSVIVGALAGYNLSRFSYRGKGTVSYYILFAYVFPPFILMVPLMMILSEIGLFDTLYGLTIIHLAYTVPFSTWMLRGYFMGVPKELEDSALVDGCSRLGALFRVILPVSVPGLVAASVFSFTLSWDDLIFALVTIGSEKNHTLPLSIAFFIVGGEIYAWGEFAAAAVLSSLPPVVLYMIIQKYVVMGLTAGAVKA